jgi:hypothetical protein
MTPGPPRASADSFHWEEAAIGAGGTLGAVLLAAAAGAALTRRRPGARRDLDRLTAPPNPTLSRTIHQEAAMLLTHITTRAALTAALAALVLSAPAAAGTHRLSGSQIPVDEANGIFKMTGSLVGDWNITAFNQSADTPLVEATGTELFTGCLDVRRNGCGTGDPKGTLSFTFTYEALFASPDPASLVWGSCRHPIASGTGGFTGAKGVLAMVDTPTPTGVQTAYIGNITLPDHHASSRRAAGRHGARRHPHARTATAPRAASCGAG